MHNQMATKRLYSNNTEPGKKFFPVEGYLVMKLKFDIDFYDDLVIEMKGIKDFQKIINDKKKIDDSKRMQRLCLPSEKREKGSKCLAFSLTSSMIVFNGLSLFSEGKHNLCNRLLSSISFLSLMIF